MFVEPDLLEAFEHQLEAWNWRRRTESFAQHLFQTHSHTFLHPSWPCDIDVHVGFPGMFGSAQEIFEGLHAHTQDYSVGGVLVRGVDLEGSLLVEILHGLRSPGSQRHAQDLRRATAVLADALTDDSFRDSFRKLVRDVGATTAISGVLKPLGVEWTDESINWREYWRWVGQSAGANRALSWLVAIVQADSYPRWKLIKEAIAPSVSDLHIEKPSIHRSGRWLWLDRARAGLTSLPRLVRSLRSPVPAVVSLNPSSIRPLHVAAPIETQRLVEPAAADQSVIASASSGYALSRVARATDTDRRYVLPLDGEIGQPYMLAAVAADLIEWIEQGVSTPESLGALASEHYGIELEAALVPLQTFLDALTRLGLLTLSPGVPLGRNQP
ncbi:PqqD family protein [Dermacoccus barathri]